MQKSWILSWLGVLTRIIDHVGSWDRTKKRMSWFEFPPTSAQHLD